MSEPVRLFRADRMVLFCAPNGARRSRTDHPAIPVTAQQLADEAGELADAGVAVLHLHVRAHDGGHSLDPDRYRQAIAAIRDRVGEQLIVQITTEAVGMYGPQQQMETVRAVRPEAVSLALRELCPDESAERGAGRFYEFLQRERIWAQHILYTPGDVNRFERFRRKGLFATDQPWCLLVLGNYAEGRNGDEQELEDLAAELNRQAVNWGVCCFGAREHQAALKAYESGGHARLGFENNMHLPDGKLAANNRELIEALTRQIDGGMRKVASVDEVRDHLLT